MGQNKIRLLAYYPLKEDFRDLGVCSDEEGILGFLDD
jgi:hypothetical protein